MGLFDVFKRGRTFRRGQDTDVQSENPSQAQLDRDAKKKEHKTKKPETSEDAAKRRVQYPAKNPAKYSAEERHFYECRNLPLPHVVAPPSDADAEEDLRRRRTPIPLIHRTSTGTFPISKSQTWRQDADQGIIIRRARSAADVHPSMSESGPSRPAFASRPSQPPQAPQATSTTSQKPDLPQACDVPTKRRSFTEVARSFLRRPLSQSEQSDVSAKTTTTEWPDAQQIEAINGARHIPPATRGDGSSSPVTQSQSPPKPSILRVNTGPTRSSPPPGSLTGRGSIKQHRRQLSEPSAFQSTPEVPIPAKSLSKQPLVLPLDMRRPQTQSNLRRGYAGTSRIQLAPPPRIRNVASGQALSSIDSRIRPSGPSSPPLRGPSPFGFLPGMPFAPAVPPRSVHRPAIIPEPFDVPGNARLLTEQKKCSHSFESRLNKPHPLKCHICGIDHVQYILICRLCQLRKCRICWRVPAVEEMIKEKEARDIADTRDDLRHRDSANDMW